jgi:hypothetical protein
MMLRTIALVSALAFMASSAAAKPTLDANGKCRDGGKFVATSMCKAPAPAGRCRDKTTKNFAKCGAPNTEPVPKAK